MKYKRLKMSLFYQGYVNIKVTVVQVANTGKSVYFAPLPPTG